MPQANDDWRVPVVRKCIFFTLALTMIIGLSGCWTGALNPTRTERITSEGTGAERVLTSSTVTVEALTPSPAGSELITYIYTSGVGKIAVKIKLPEVPRYPEGAPVVVEVSTWFVYFVGFHMVNDVTEIGAISVSYLWPERMDPESGAHSTGVYDYGGPDSLMLLRDVINFASGVKSNIDGYYISDLIAVTPLTDNIGLWASSHSGVLATNVLAYHGSEMPNVGYLIGRENPTLPEMYPLEIGHFDDQRNKVINPFYYPEEYTPTSIHVDYSSVGWFREDAQDRGRPYFAASAGRPQHILHEEICPKLWGKRYYSHPLTEALLVNGALTLDDWPEDLATPDETKAWAFRTVVFNYPKIAVQIPDLKVMLVFADYDHVQAAADKPHIHQAYDGFRHTAGLPWVRMNPDIAYVEQIEPNLPPRVPDNDANTEPADWSNSEQWGFPSLEQRRQKVWLAAVAEMVDRVHFDDWRPNLEQVLFTPRQ